MCHTLPSRPESRSSLKGLWVWPAGQVEAWSEEQVEAWSEGQVEAWSEELQMVEEWQHVGA